MNSILIRTFLLSFALAGVLIALSCGGGDQNGGNKPGNAANNNNNLASGTGTVNIDSSCYTPDIGNRVTAVNTAIHTVINNDPRYGAIKQQLAPPNNRFQINVYADAGNQYLHVYLEGQLKGKNPFKKMPDLLEPFMAAGCVEKVWLTLFGAPAPTDKLLVAPGFLWGGCEEGLVPCRTGECVQNLSMCPGGGIVNGNLSSSNSNTGPNSNSNSNAYSNSNSNAPPNSNLGNKSQ